MSESYLHRRCREHQDFVFRSPFGKRGPGCCCLRKPHQNRKVSAEDPMGRSPHRQTSHPYRHKTKHDISLRYSLCIVCASFCQTQPDKNAYSNILVRSHLRECPTMPQPSNGSQLVCFQLCRKNQLKPFMQELIQKWSYRAEIPSASRQT